MLKKKLFAVVEGVEPEARLRLWIVLLVAATVLVLARTGSDLAVLWFPLWGPGRLAKHALPDSRG